MLRVRRDGAVPGCGSVAPASTSSAIPFNAVMFVAVLRADHHDPGAARATTTGVPVAFLAVVSIAVIGLYIAYVIPIFLRWRMGDEFEPGPWTSAASTSG